MTILFLYFGAMRRERFGDKRAGTKNGIKEEDGDEKQDRRGERNA